ERLAAFGVPVDHVTYLDPHDFDQPWLPVDGEQRQSEVGAPSGYGASVWKNVDFADAYYQTRNLNGAFVPDGLVPGGRPIPGAFNFLVGDGDAIPDALPDSDAANPYSLADAAGDHGWVWNAFYLSTVMGALPAGVAAPEIPFDFEETGYALSRIADPVGALRNNPAFGPNFYGETQDHTYSSDMLVRPDGLPTVSGLEELHLTPEDVIEGRWAPKWDSTAIVNGDFEAPGSAIGHTVPGWSYHGGGGTGHVDADGDNHYLELDLNDGIRTHNWLYVPNDATYLTFDLWRSATSADDSFEVRLGNDVIRSFALTTADAGFVRQTVPIPADRVNLVQTLTFEIVAGGGVDSEVRIDNIAFAWMPVWVEQGPALIDSQHLGEVAQAANTGAVQAIVVHPENPNLVYVGTVNGGIWRALNAGSTSTPAWEPLTDHLPSLAIGDLVLNPGDTTPLDPSDDILYAGTGSFSSAGDDGGGALGVLKTTDGGATWQVLGRETFEGLRIASILPIAAGGGQIVLAAANDLVDDEGEVLRHGGVFRSIDGGVHWSPLSNISGSGIPLGPASDLVAVPATADRPLRVYAALSGQGIWMSESAGATWTPANDGISEVGNATRIALAAHEASGTVYAALIGSPRAVLEAAAKGATELIVDDVSGFQSRDLVVVNTEPATATLTQQVEINERVFHVADAAAFVGAGGLEFELPGVMGSRTIEEVRVADGTIVVDLPVPFAIPIGTIISTFKEEHRVKAIDPDRRALILYEPLVVRHPGGEVVEAGGNALVALLRTTATSWTALPLPTTTFVADPEIGAETAGLHPSSQGRHHFSMVVDPVDPDVLFVGGDTQLEIPNAAGLRTFGGRVFRGDFGTEVAPSEEWEEIVGVRANDSFPHADSRAMVFAIDPATGGRWILEADDGGIYRLDNPNTPDARFWDS
ncbi:MAG: hypothetical protein WD176_07410, partial [Pirellulales bacterium]